jgi:hypothetical protein
MNYRGLFFLRFSLQAFLRLSHPGQFISNSQIVRTWGAAMLRPYTEIARTKESPMPQNTHIENIGMIVEIAGVASAVAGVILSLHHWPAAAALIGGGVAYIIGKKLRAE